MKRKKRKKLILATIEDLVTDFTYYGRKEDEELTTEDLMEAVESGEVTIDEMVEHFREKLNNIFK